MTFPPLPPLSLNVSQLAIQQLHIADIVVDQTTLGDTFTHLYYLFVTLFTLVLLQTAGLGWFLVQYYQKSVRPTSVPLLNSKFDEIDT